MSTRSTARGGAAGATRERELRDELEQLQRERRELEAEAAVEHSARFLADRAAAEVAVATQRERVTALSLEADRAAAERDALASRVRALTSSRRDLEQRSLPLVVLLAIPALIATLAFAFQGGLSVGGLLLGCGGGLGLAAGVRGWRDASSTAASWHGRAVVPLLGAIAAVGGAGLVFVEWARLGFAPDEQLVGWSSAAEHLWLSLAVHACAALAVTNAFGQPSRRPVLVTSAVALLATLVSWAQWLPPRHADMAPEILEAYPWVDTLASRWCLPLGSVLAPAALGAWWLAARDGGARRWVFVPVAVLSGVAFFARVAMGEHSFATVSFVPPAALALAVEAVAFALMLGVLATRAPGASRARWLVVAAAVLGPALFWLPA